MTKPTGMMDDDLIIDRFITYLATDGNALSFSKFMSSDSMQNLIKFLHENYSDIINQPDMIRKIFKMVNLDHDVAGKDAWAYGQLKSKFWLVKKLYEMDVDLGSVWILCGWVGTLTLLINHYKIPIRYKDIRSFDLDPRCAVLAETLNRPIVMDEWKFKATTRDVNTILYEDFNYETLRYDGSTEVLFEKADTIINTSCEHLSSDEWWDNIPVGRLVILQSNNFFEHDDHTRPVNDLDEFISRYKMTEMMFTGEMDCNLYKRYMIIGRK